MKSVEDITQSHKDISLIHIESEARQGLQMKESKKILARVQDRFENELVGDSPHINHTSFDQHSDTYTP
jgi:hypothetical protein